MALAAGSFVLRVCRFEPKNCRNTRCQLRPLCECAVQEYGRAKKLENRVWFVVGIGGLIGVVWWVVAGLLPMFA